MSRWPSTKARSVLNALLRTGWNIKRHQGTSHRVLARSGWKDFVALSDTENGIILSNHSTQVTKRDRYGT